MPFVELLKRFSGKPALVTGALILLALIVLIWFRTEGPELPSRPKEAGDQTAPVTSDSVGIKEPAAVSPGAEGSTATDARRRPPDAPPKTGGREHRERRITEVVDVSGRVDSWQDWNSSFSDTVTRTYSAIFDSARLDTLPGGVLAFSPSGRSQDFAPVIRVFCRIDSVRELVKHTFPGQSVKFNIGVAFAPSLAFRGILHPEETTVVLRLFTPEDENVAAADIVRNQFIVVLNSPPGYAYTLKTGIECAAEGGSEGTTVFYTRPVIVEFRRMVRYESLLSRAADVVFLLTSNPEAVRDVSTALPGSIINVVFVPRNDPREADDIRNEVRANLRLHVIPPRVLDQSFLILNESEALVEENTLDPDFKHIAQLRTKTLQVDQVGHPRVTRLIENTSEVARLKLTYQNFRRLNP